MPNRPIVKLRPDQIDQVRRLVIHDEGNILAFNKPSGLAVQTRGNRGTSLDHLLWAFARSNGKRPRLVHRIDSGTSGLVLAARTKPVAAFLSQQFETRRVRKTYYALIGGDLPRQSAGICDIALLKSGRLSRPSSLEKGADPALTKWRILQRGEGLALAEARPVTGRMHQIRVHFSAMGCPIMGDPVYGNGTESAPRLMLHAASLSLTAPQGHTLSLSAPVAEDMLNWQAERLGKQTLQIRREVDERNVQS